MHSEKLISALCITYGRPHNLEEAIESFLRQDYPNKELIIVNDLAEQTLIFDHPQVKIFNFKDRFFSIGLKRNKSAELSSGEILTLWDDDDIYLPWALSQFVIEFEQNPAVGLIKPDMAWVYIDNILEFRHGLAANIAFTKKAFNDVGGFVNIDLGEDINLLDRLVINLTPKRFKNLSLRKEDYAFICVWHRDSYHLSDKENGIFGFTKVEQYVKSKLIEPLVVLSPHWKHDYVEMISDKIKEQV